MVPKSENGVEEEEKKPIESESPKSINGKGKNLMSQNPFVESIELPRI